ncbi:hypothetical protein HDU98_006796 [Podochytrium sp. JEL0797]|nr:hypothetical protein HDU98_006796 [Podochytrium sp. JEL0797]
MHRRLLTTAAAPLKRSRKTALIFPGQGSQFVGMGLDIYSEFKSAKAVMDECEEAVGGSLKHVMFNGPINELTLTANAQPAILCHSIALLRVLTDEFGCSVKTSSFALGHSLGEYTALVATESIGLSEAIKLVRLRGEAMQMSVSNKKTAMRALVVTKGHLEDIEAVMERMGHMIPDGEVAEIANVNSRKQVVISGSAKGVDYACSVIQAKGYAGRAVSLPVSAPFHCSLMLPAAEAMRPALEATNFKEPIIDVISNVTGRPFKSASEIGPSLIDQITKTVQWQRCVQYARDDFVDEWVAIGPSKVLSNLLKREYPVDKVRNISTAQEVAEFGRVLGDESYQDSYFI